jgi:hypothetical protein
MRCSLCLQVGHNRRNRLCPVNFAAYAGHQTAQQTRGLETLQRLILLRDSINVRIQENLQDIMIHPDVPALPNAPDVVAIADGTDSDAVGPDYDAVGPDDGPDGPVGPDYDDVGPAYVPNDNDYNDDYYNHYYNDDDDYNDVLPAYHRHYPLKKMVTLSFDTANIGEATECPICYENECNVVTGCGHGFCRVCVQTQFLASKTTPTHPMCALCRQEMCELSSTSDRTLAGLEEFMESENINTRMLY